MGDVKAGQESWPEIPIFSTVMMVIVGFGIMIIITFSLNVHTRYSGYESD